MGTRTEPVMIRTKSKSKFVNIWIKFKFLTLKNPNRTTESERIYVNPWKKVYNKSLNKKYNK